MIALHIAGRELRSYFATTMGWLVMAVLLLLSGLLWVMIVGDYIKAGVEVAANPYSYEQMNISDWVLAPYFGAMAFILLMIAPALSMRSFSDELKSKSIELLLTSPIGTADIVIGKFLGALGFIAVSLALTAYVPLSLWAWGTPDWGVLATGYGVLLCTSGAVISLGMLASSFTEHQVVSLAIGVGGSLAAWLVQGFGVPADMAVGKLVTSIGSAVGAELPKPSEVFEALSIGAHMESMTRGSVWTSDLVFFASFIGFFLFATAVRVDSYRWR